MLRIAITGGIACGKSLVGAFLAEQGVPVCDADALVHGLMEAGQPVHGQIVDAFGRGVLLPEGAIDRRALGQAIFQDPAARRRLNAIVHPKVIAAWRQWLAEREKEGDRAAVVIVPLLYEIGDGGSWDAVLCVSAPEDFQIRRLEERGLSRTDAVSRIRAQMDVGEKTAKADYVVVNKGSRAVLRRQTLQVWESILGDRKVCA